ncbi:hypothetical protein [Paraburkholderia rhizosphaerae]|uniref:Type II secretion system (T2SS) protein M subtype b n=1 Tax=Paraburkholderia rhizosphaerae TaxID=480658 RepID=A0A4R8KNU0_9BURK|nr:hypothetical protein [Paraburkholderia rhizosphaerae]TDY31271.1 hypothetical protein BX592_1528 [Paraburkholderia rhizosphaerae]
MNLPPQLIRSLLRAQLALRRASLDVLIAGVLVLAAAAMWFALLPGLTTRIADEARAVVRARSAPPPAPVLSPQAMAAERLAAFYAALGDAGHTEQIVTHLFGAASDTGVVLDKTEYKPARDPAGRFETYTIVLPVKGDYAKLRSFCEKVLTTVPYAALDDMRFKRGSANDQTVEASLRFTVFLRPAQQGKSATLVAAGEVHK